MSEFSKFQDNINAKLESQRQRELAINREQVRLAERLDNFFSGLHEELLRQNVPLYQTRFVQEAYSTSKLVKEKTLFRPAVYEEVIVPRQEVVTEYDYWRLYHRKRTPSGRDQSYEPSRDLIMQKSGELYYFEDSETINDKYLVYRALSEISSYPHKYDSILSLLEPSIKELLNIK
jgi:hypothetical protein